MAADDAHESDRQKVEVRRRRKLSPADITALGAAYAAHHGKLDELAALWGISIDALEKLARTHHWQRTNYRRALKEDENEEARHMAHRILKALEQQLSDIEHRMQRRAVGKSAGRATSAEHERDARTLASLTRTLESLTEFTESRQKKVAAHDAPHDFRAELERRLTRLAGDAKPKRVS